MLAVALATTVFFTLGAPASLTGSVFRVEAYQEVELTHRQQERTDSLHALLAAASKGEQLSEVELRSRLSKVQREWRQRSINLINQFAVPLDFEQLSKLVIIQGASEILDKLVTTGLSRQAIADLCSSDSSAATPLQVAQYLLGERNSQQELSLSEGQALAAGCLSAYMQQGQSNLPA